MQKSDARAQWHQSTVPAEALRHHADLQAQHTTEALGFDHDEPDQSPPQPAHPTTATSAQSSRALVRSSTTPCC